MDGGVAVSFVTATDIFQSYGARPILERVNVEVEEGEFISIVGASGCGKSTFLRLLLAQERPTRGEIRVAGAEPAQEPGLDRGVVFQRYSVFPHMTVRENVVAGESFRTTWGRFFGAERKAALARADEVLSRIGLDHVSDQYPAT
ncbi:MAG: ATP-binding cassette domain-containing protein, partial [Pseudomonadota bacterium]